MNDGIQHYSLFAAEIDKAHCRLCVFPLTSGEHQNMGIPLSHQLIVANIADFIRNFVSIPGGGFVRADL